MESTGRLARSFALASFLGSALVGCAAMDLGAPESAEAGFDVDESYFYVSLSSYGNWVNSAQFGWVWYPYNRPSAWRPYTMGRWVYTSYGEWMWVSDEPFGWATYHYGRWYLDPYYGWAWVPGRVWAPAWVSWRDCDDYVGWAPLAPWGYWDSYYGGYRYGDRYWGSYNRYNGHYGHHDDHDGDHHGDGDHDGGYDGNRPGRGAWGDGYRTDRDDPDQWNFTRKRDFAGGRVDKAILDRRQVQDVFRRSRDLPPPSEQEVREGRGVSRGFDRAEIERAAGRPIRPVKVEDETSKPDPKRGWGQKFDEKQGRVQVYRPAVKEKKPDATPDRLGVARPVDRNRGGLRDERGAAGGGRDTTRQPDRNAKPGGGSLWPAPSGDGGQGRSRDLDPDRQRELDRKREVENRQDEERRREVDRKRELENRQDAERRRELDRQREEGNRKIDERRRAADLERRNEGRPPKGSERIEQQGGGRESGKPSGRPSSGYGTFDRTRPGGAPSGGSTREFSRPETPKPERVPEYKPSHQPAYQPNRGGGSAAGAGSSPSRGSQPSAPTRQPSYQPGRGGDSGGARPSGGYQPSPGGYGGHGSQGSPGGVGGSGGSGGSRGQGSHGSGSSGGGHGSPAGGSSGGFGSPGGSGGAGGGAGGFGR